MALFGLSSTLLIYCNTSNYQAPDFSVIIIPYHQDMVAAIPAISDRFVRSKNCCIIVFSKEVDRLRLIRPP